MKKHDVSKCSNTRFAVVRSGCIATVAMIAGFFIAEVTMDLLSRYAVSSTGQYYAAYFLHVVIKGLGFGVPVSVFLGKLVSVLRPDVDGE